MKIFKNKNSLKKAIADKDIAFIPTMGSLHSGHKKLIYVAKKKCKFTLVSIFVNPKQFNSNYDFKRYPRSLRQDIKILKNLKVTFLYIPNFNQVYNFKTKYKVSLHKFQNKLCGKFRPGHFKGVLNVVNRFLEILNPKYIVLGKKDFQQMFLIKDHIKKNKINTKIIVHKIVRKNNGVALSSRNKNLSTSDMTIASKVFRYLKREKSNIKRKIQKKINTNKLYNNIIELGVKKIDYIELINLNTLKKPNRINKKFNIFIAYYLGKVRLIDNV